MSETSKGDPEVSVLVILKYPFCKAGQLVSRIDERPEKSEHSSEWLRECTPEIKKAIRKLEKLSPFYNVDILGMFNLKFSWGFSWNQFFGASKIARSWALYLESNLGVVLSDSPEGRLVWVSQIFQDSACQTEKNYPNFGSWKSLESGGSAILLNLNKKQKKKQKSLSFFCDVTCRIWKVMVVPGGNASRGSQEMNNATGTYIFTENCPEAQAIPTFFGGGWRWMTRSSYSNQTRRPISKMPWKGRLVSFSTLPRYKWYRYKHLFPFLNG